ncbi:MAG: aminotransferase class IV [Nocardioidaceae bacterium]
MRAWCNGQLVDPTEPAVSPLDHGVTVGDGVFEAIKVMHDEPFALTRHLRRLTRSARGLGLPDPDHDMIRSAIRLTLDQPEMSHGLIRITFTAGISPLGSSRDTKEPTVVVIATPAPKPANSTSAVTVPWPRNERGALRGLKTTSYGENVLALAYAAERNATEAIFTNMRGDLCEGTGTNVFCVFNEAVVTPPLTAGCLAGITRELVIEWCDVQERDLTMGELHNADEVFLTSTTRDVQAVGELDGVLRPDRRPVTAAIAQAWRRAEALDIDP